MFASHDLLIKMISRVFHGGLRRGDRDSSSFALSFCLRASRADKTCSVNNIAGAIAISLLCSRQHASCWLEDPSIEPGVDYQRMMLASGCLHVIVYISTGALESRISMTTSALARIIDYHFMLGILKPHNFRFSFPDNQNN